mgnify:CR=1 FL=1
MGYQRLRGFAVSGLRGETHDEAVIWYGPQKKCGCERRIDEAYFTLPLDLSLLSRCLFQAFFAFTTMPDWTDCISMSDVTCFTSAAVPRAAFCMRICRFLAAKKVQNSSRQSVNVYHRERGRKICICIGGFFYSGLDTTVDQYV